mgnify:CR=1 FL=1
MPRLLALLLALLCHLFAANVTAATAEETAAMHLQLHLDPHNHPGLLRAVATVSIPPGQRLALRLSGLEVTAATLADNQGRHSELSGEGEPAASSDPKGRETDNEHSGLGETSAADASGDHSHLGHRLLLPPAAERRTLRLAYEKRLAGEGDNRLEADGIALTSTWHPRPEQPLRFSLSTELPPGFSAICESDQFPLQRQGNLVKASFAQPITAMHFVAGPYRHEKRQVRDGLAVHALFFPEDAELAPGYLEAAAASLQRYEIELGPYPYSHYAIVANRLPSGLGIPTFALLGRTVLRLPFIKDTSLPHEIVHSWFGNAVEIDARKGNWCEGLTAYLADHRQREDRGEGIAHRHETISRYLAYADEGKTLALRDFISADHHQEEANLRRVVGYNRGAMLFHELRQRIGHEAFSRALRRFASDYRFRQASWQELGESFSAAAGTDLSHFFEERLTREEIPELALTGVSVAAADTGWLLSFTLLQKSERPFTLRVPLAIATASGDLAMAVDIKEATTPFTLRLDKRPLALTVDPSHSMLRRLAEAETAPSWSRFLGGRQRLAILADESDRQRYQPLLQALGEPLEVITAAEASDRRLTGSHLLFLGTDQPAARRLFASPQVNDNGLNLEVRRNPLSPGHVAVLLDMAEDNREQPLLSRLGHYGRYAKLAFRDGANTAKSVATVEHGIRVDLETLPQGGATAALSSFSGVVEKLSEAAVVYLGETHTSYGDHLMQLRVIEALYRRDPRLVIAMEMFPHLAQPSLDRYLTAAERSNEREFLQESGYFRHWRFDYRLYRDILLFAREKRIPVIALNLPQEIVSQVARHGGSDVLDPATLASLPGDRDLDLPGYAERLAESHAMHRQAGLGDGPSAGFLQAQALWDETMAATVADYARSHPETRLVVLAGTQHARKDNGIPPRVARRIGLTQLVAINLADGLNVTELDKIADFYFLSQQASLPEAGKIGITLEPAPATDAPALVITALSPHGRAAQGGIEVGDILLAVNGYPVQEFADIQIALLDAQVGESATVTVRRERDGASKEHNFAVQLTAAKPSFHP